MKGARPAPRDAEQFHQMPATSALAGRAAAAAAAARLQLSDASRVQVRFTLFDLTRTPPLLIKHDI